MNTEKQIFHIFYIVLFLIFCGSAAGASEVVVSVQDAAGLPGESVTVFIMAEKASHVAGGQLDLSFDSRIVEVKSIKRGDLISGLFMGNKQYQEDSLRIVWAGLEGTGKDNGVLCEVEFLLKNSGESELIFNNVLLKDSSVKDVFYRTLNGLLTVTGDSTQEGGEKAGDGTTGSTGNGREEPDGEESQENEGAAGDDVSSSPDSSSSSGSDASGSTADDDFIIDGAGDEAEFSVEDIPKGEISESEGEAALNKRKFIWPIIFFAVVIVGIYLYKKRNIS